MIARATWTGTRGAVGVIEALPDDWDAAKEASACRLAAHDRQSSCSAYTPVVLQRAYAFIQREFERDYDEVVRRWTAEQVVEFYLDF